MQPLFLPLDRLTSFGLVPFRRGRSSSSPSFLGRVFPWSMGPVVAALGALLLGGGPCTAPACAEIAARTLRAVRAESPPRVDGVLDDAVWTHAPRFSGFTQRDPDEGQPATERTEVQLAFDDQALYAAITLYDSEPDSIVNLLVRRDRDSESDRFILYLDPRHDRHSAYWFQVNAAGSLADGLISNDGVGRGSWDETWNAVWDARVQRSRLGWTVEYRIPYSCLRFRPAVEYTWGINLQREIGRKKESAYWVMVPREKSGFVSRFADLVGIRSIHPSRALEILPYGTSQLTLAPAGDPDGGDVKRSVGVDLRYGITSGTSLSATVNPDFGQTESDPAVLNLSVFETFQQERRPFFLEGAQDFKTPIQLFYSRRIGRRPGYLPLADGWSQIDAPVATTILGAAKVTGKTATRTTFDVLAALTAQEEAMAESTFVDADTGRQLSMHRRLPIEPRTGFLVGRVRQDLGQGTSHVGALVTVLDRRHAPGAYSGGLDWTLKWHGSAYEFSGQVAANRTESWNDVQKGWASQLLLSRNSGWLQGRLQSDLYSRGFQINDLGFLRRNDYADVQQTCEIVRNRPWWKFRHMQARLEHRVSWNLSGVKLGQEVSVDTWNELRSFWHVGGSFGHAFWAQDDLDTRGGPLIATPARDWVELWLSSDRRRTVSGWIFVNLGRDAGHGYWRRAGSGITLRPGTRTEVRLRPRLTWRRDGAHWVENVDDDGDGREDHFVYGRLDSRTLDLTTRASYLINRDLSLELYLQPFVSSGRYSSYRELVAPGGYVFAPFPAPTTSPDFRRRSLRGNLVVRWEYRPGSTLFAVWSLDRGREFGRYAFRPFHDAWDSFSDGGTDIFLLKINYWLSR